MTPMDHPPTLDDQVKAIARLAGVAAVLGGAIVLAIHYLIFH